jgi:hypothetical protein
MHAASGKPMATDLKDKAIPRAGDGRPSAKADQILYQLSNYAAAGKFAADTLPG